jgi:hypothetical protein
MGSKLILVLWLGIPIGFWLELGELKTVQVRAPKLLCWSAQLNLPFTVSARTTLLGSLLFDPLACRSPLSLCVGLSCLFWCITQRRTLIRVDTVQLHDKGSP